MREMRPWVIRLTYEPADRGCGEASCCAETDAAWSVVMTRTAYVGTMDEVLYGMSDGLEHPRKAVQDALLEY